MQNVQGIQESALVVFGGLVSEVNAFDVPAGSSPVCCDMDFTVTSVKVRDGLATIYSFIGNDETANAGAGSSVAPGTAWTNPGNIAVAGQSATVNVGLNSSSAFLEGTNFGFTIPATSSITGITVTVNGSAFKTGAGSVSTTQFSSPPVSSNYQATVIGFDSMGTPNVVQGPNATGNTGSYAGVATTSFSINPIATTTGDFLIVTASFNVTGLTPTVTDGVNTWTQIVNFTAEGVQTVWWTATAISNQAAGTITVGTGGVGVTLMGAGYWEIANLAGTFSVSQTGSGTSTNPTAGNITTVTANTFALNLAVTYPTSINTLNVGAGWTQPTIELNPNTGGNFLRMSWQYQTVTSGGVASNGTLSITPNQFTASATAKSFTVGLSSTPVTLGGSTDLWGVSGWTPALVNNPAFGFAITGIATSIATTFNIFDPMTVTVWYGPPASVQFDYIKSFEMTAGDTLNLALDSSGIFWQEDVLNTPNVLTPFYTAIEPNTFARSVTQDNREFIALSNLTNGTDMPRQYNGQWVDRISQVGPGAPPSISSTSTSYNVVSITQPAAVSIDGVSGHGGVQWTSGVNSHTPGNVIIPYTDNAAFLNGVSVGSVVFLQLTGAGLSGGNGTYIVTSTGSALGMESGDGENFQYFTVTAPSTAQLNVHTDPVSPGTYQLTLATLTVNQPVPGLTVGSQITLAGVTPGAWNGTWTISNVVNGGSLQITSTQLVSDVATYNYTITSGVGPSVGSFVTITGCTNGPVVNGQSIFNQFEAIVNSVGPGYFTVFPINAANVALAPETTAVALVLGTKFQFDPGLNDVGTATNPILGNAGASGTVVIAGGLGAGLRQAVVMFETRNGYITQPSPPVAFNLTASANSITATNLPIGPPNTIARIVAFTAANGGFYFYIPKPVSVISAGQTINYTSTVINDNTSTQATFNFTDTLLLASTSIDSQGNNLFAQKELGSSIGVISYSQRLFAWGEQNKILNLLNMSFDGGYLAQTQTTPLQPLGWTVDPTNGAGGFLTSSPLFGNGYEISNTSGSTQAIYGMIEQSAYQDYNKVPIINVQTKYSVRVTASCPVLTASGNLVIDLFSPSFMNVFGSFSTPLSGLTTTMQIITGTLLTTAFQTSVPADLLLRVYATSIPNNGQVLIDRIEPFDVSQPVLTTQLTGSYFDNFEAFDAVTGNLGVGEQNQQPVRNAFELFDTLYVIRSKSMASTTDNGVSEPSGWTVREVSNKVGTPSIAGVDVGEGWALICGESGLYLFSGGEPVKINPELDGNPGLWQTILWGQGQQVWIRNDTEKRKIYIGVPIPTPNQWMPRFPVNTAPSQPNVVLMCNYKELMSSGALAGEGPLRLTYTGELKSYALGRKWSAWSIQACYADFIDRPNTALNEYGPIFFCSDQGPFIYQQIAGNFADAGAAMHADYYTYGFPKTSEAQALQMGLTELEAKYMTVLVQGSGNLQMTVLPDSLSSQDAQAIYPEAMFNPPLYDTEIPLNALGNRFFVEFYVEQPGEWFEISRVVMAIAQSAWMPVRGRNQ